MKDQAMAFRRATERNDRSLRRCDKVRLVTVIAFTCLCCIPAALAQTAATGALTGTVTDMNGAGVANAQIKVTNVVTGETRGATSQVNGAYIVPLLPPGNYRVEVAQSGFKSAARAGLPVNVTETTKLDVRLEVGAITETMAIEDRKSTRLNSSHLGISYAVFCLKKKKHIYI